MMKVNTDFEICAGRKIPKLAAKTFKNGSKDFSEIKHDESSKNGSDKDFLLGMRYLWVFNIVWMFLKYTQARCPVDRITKPQNAGLRCRHDSLPVFYCGLVIRSKSIAGKRDLSVR